MPKLTTARVLGLLFGGLVTAIMIFMMFAILGNLIRGDQ